MRLLLLLFFFSCSQAPPGPPTDAYHVLIFTFKVGETTPKIIKECEPYSLKSGRLAVKSAAADFTEKGMYCLQNGHHIDFECTSAFKIGRAVLVQGNRECQSIPNETMIRERRSL